MLCERCNNKLDKAESYNRFLLNAAGLKNYKIKTATLKV